MEKILIALDYSASAFKVAELGNRLAKSIGAQVILLHVIGDFTYYSSLNYSPITGFADAGNTIENNSIDALRDLAEKYLASCKQQLHDESIETVVRSGDYAEVILQTASELKVDLIVMGTHVRHGLEKILVESVAEKVFNHSAVPSLIIPIKSLESHHVKPAGGTLS